MNYKVIDATVAVIARDPEHALDCVRDFTETFDNLNTPDAYVSDISEPDYKINLDEEYLEDLTAAGLNEYLVDITFGVRKMDATEQDVASEIEDLLEYYNKYISDFHAERIHLEYVSEMDVVA